MNLIVGAPWWLIIILMLALGAAAIEDAVRLRISNLICAVRPLNSASTMSTVSSRSIRVSNVSLAATRSSIAAANC